MTPPDAAASSHSHHLYHVSDRKLSRTPSQKGPGGWERQRTFRRRAASPLRPQHSQQRFARRAKLASSGPEARITEGTAASRPLVLVRVPLPYIKEPLVPASQACYWLNDILRLLPCTRQASQSRLPTVGPNGNTGGSDLSRTAGSAGTI